MAEYLGRNGSKLLFSSGEYGVVVDSKLNLVTETGYLDVLSTSSKWDSRDAAPFGAINELASGALASLDIRNAAASRKYTVPKGVQAEAKKALSWASTNARGGTHGSLHTATLLASGGQIDFSKVRNIAKFFPRHESEAGLSGWTPADKSFPSAQRVTWGMWGGDAARKWVASIIEQENTKALTADGYAAPGYVEDPSVYLPTNSYPSDVDAFKDAYMLDSQASPEFLARVRLDGSGFDRLYKIDLGGEVYVWDDGNWDDMGAVDGDIWAYDQMLDDPYDVVPKDHVVIDVDAAIIISARLQENPFGYVTIEEIDQDEARMAADALDEVDWSFVDQSMTAAAVPGAVASPAAPADAGDGVYSPSERSANAEKQVRDASGKFAAVGDSVQINGNPATAGKITNVDGNTANVTVQLNNGSSVVVPANTVAAPTGMPSTSMPSSVSVPAVDLSGILAEPRVPINEPNAIIPGTLPAMDANSLHNVIANWPAFVKSQRDAFVPTTKPNQIAVQPKGSMDIGAEGKAEEAKTGLNYDTDPYDNPLLSAWLKQTNSAGTAYPNAIWAMPLTAAIGAGEPGVTPIQSPPGSAATDANGDPEKEMTPNTSDVSPIYLAEVAPDDPRAVLALIALVPASSTSTMPMTYTRDKGVWNRDPKALADLQSATPPPVVPLDAATLKDVLKQVDDKQDQSTSNPEAPANAAGVNPAAVDATTPATTTTAPPITPPAAAPKAPAAAPLAASASHQLMVMWGPSKDLMGLVAAGGLDQNSGNAETLRRYWTKGPGGAKIAWNTPGDWTRCVRQLGKYLGDRAKGYCALRHKEMTGMWTGDKRNLSLAGRGLDGKKVMSAAVLRTEDDIIKLSELRARALSARQRVAGIVVDQKAMVAGLFPQDGGRFRIPLVLPEALESGDGRIAERGAIMLRNLPLPLMWQINTASGHDGAVVVGRIDYMERTDQGIGNAVGYFDGGGVYGQEAERMVRNHFLYGVSADMDKFEATEEEVLADEPDDDGEDVTTDQLVINKARVMGVTIVAKPAFQECQIIMDDEYPEEEDMLADGIYVDDVDVLDAAALTAAAVTASAIPLEPPAEWFENPKLNRATPLSVSEDGHVFGHIAAWHVDHIGMANNTRPPQSRSNYAYFNTGRVRTAEGTDALVGQLTLAGGHASINASASEAVKHYDDTASAIADVHAGEDAHGIWVAGALRPDATPTQIRALRASAPSGDWRPIKGHLELVAVCQVNVPGFPIAQARVASGQVMALVAAGAMTLAKMKTDPMAEMTARLESLEQFANRDLETKAAAAAARFSEVRNERNAQLATRAAELAARVSTVSDYAFIPKAKRDEMAKNGQAMPDGSFPIANETDLKKAIKAHGRSAHPVAVKKHIKKRARALGKTNLIPPEWMDPAEQSSALSATVSDLRARVAAASSAVNPKVAE